MQSHMQLRVKFTTVGIQLNKEDIFEEMVQHSHDMFMDTWWSDLYFKVNLSNKDHF